MGSYIDGLDLHQMCNVWVASASYIVRMYNMRVKSRQGRIIKVFTVPTACEDFRP